METKDRIEVERERELYFTAGSGGGGGGGPEGLRDLLGPGDEGGLGLQGRAPHECSF